MYVIKTDSQYVSHWAYYELPPPPITMDTDPEAPVEHSPRSSSASLAPPEPSPPSGDRQTDPTMDYHLSTCLEHYMCAR